MPAHLTPSTRPTAPQGSHKGWHTAGRAALGTLAYDSSAGGCACSISLRLSCLVANGHGSIRSQVLWHPLSSALESEQATQQRRGSCAGKEMAEKQLGKVKRAIVPRMLQWPHHTTT